METRPRIRIKNSIHFKSQKLFQRGVLYRNPYYLRKNYAHKLLLSHSI